VLEEILREDDWRNKKNNPVSSEDMNLKQGARLIPLMGASKDLATVTMTLVPKTQKISYTKRPPSRMQPVTTLFRLRISIPVRANARPNTLLAIQCCDKTRTTGVSDD
jgi:hypothetical protein